MNYWLYFLNSKTASALEALLGLHIALLHTHMLIPSCRLQYSNYLVVSFVEIDMQIKWICSSVLLRDFLKSNPRGNFEPFKYESDNRVGPPNQGAGVWDLSGPTKENGKDNKEA